MGNCFGARVLSANTPPNSGAPAAGAATTIPAAANRAGEPLSRKAGGEGGGQEQEVGRSTPAGDARGLHAFSYADLRTATRNFRPDSFLGEGGFGSVFKGHIDERTYAPTRPGQGILVAVKKLNPDGLQGHKEWMAELYFLGELRHPNLVRLIGYCSEEEHRLLVYEFLARGSLENHLFGRSHRSLSWTSRLKIARDAARGLAFLHDLPRQVIYRDFKTSNILLDSEFNAKLSDFGLAKDGPTGDNTHVTTRVMGTYGYAAPEYVATGRLTFKSDVYGFGVVLLEIMTGKRAVDTDRMGVEQNLVEWAAPYLMDKNKWSRVLDQKLDGQYSRKGAEKAASLALECLQQDAKMRPTMKEVLEVLESLLGPKQLSTTTTTPSSKPRPKPLHLTPFRDHTHGMPHATTQGPDGQALAVKQSNPPTPPNAFKLPSPKPAGSGREMRKNVDPSPFPARASLHRQPNT